MLWLLLIVGIANGQSAPTETQPQPFRALIQHFKSGFPWSAQVKLPLIYDPSTSGDRGFRVMLSDSALNLHKERLVIRVPYQKNPYPIDYSIIYQNRLVSLFDPGQFVCLTVDGLKRDLAYEKKLNTRQFEYHWLLGGRLVALSGGVYYWFDERAGWRVYTEPVPLSKQPTFYEDQRYIAFSTCQGEFGGTLFFYDKQTRLTHFMPSVCTVSVIRQPDGYYVLASLGHGMGSADLSLIKNPSALPILKRLIQQVVPEADSTRLTNVVMPTAVFDQYSCQFFAGFERNGKLTYLVNWGQRTFLAEVAGDTIFIKDPLLNDDLYTHNPVTTTYAPSLTLVNLDFYGIGREREIACLLFRGNRIIKINWNLRDERTH